MLQFGSQKLPVYCNMDGTDLGNCGCGGWTLVMKIDGSKVTSTPKFYEVLNAVTTSWDLGGTPRPVTLLVVEYSVCALLPSSLS